MDTKHSPPLLSYLSLSSLALSGFLCFLLLYKWQTGSERPSECDRGQVFASPQAALSCPQALSLWWKRTEQLRDGKWRNEDCQVERCAGSLLSSGAEGRKLRSGLSFSCELSGPGFTCPVVGSGAPWVHELRSGSLPFENPVKLSKFFKKKTFCDL